LNTLGSDAEISPVSFAGREVSAWEGTAWHWPAKFTPARVGRSGARRQMLPLSRSM
jgi:hypothetical protein